MAYYIDHCLFARLCYWQWAGVGYRGHRMCVLRLRVCACCHHHSIVDIIENFCPICSTSATSHSLIHPSPSPSLSLSLLPSISRLTPFAYLQDRRFILLLSLNHRCTPMASPLVASFNQQWEHISSPTIYIYIYRYSSSFFYQVCGKVTNRLYSHVHPSSSSSSSSSSSNHPHH